VTHDVAQRWESLLARVPALRPWLSQMVQRRRAQLDGSEQELQEELARWLREFEQLPPFAASAIATTLQDDAPFSPPPRAAELQPSTSRGELSVDELEALLGDPAFALAFHCVEVRVRPALHPSPPRVPETAWFGLLHASARPQATLTAEVAVALVLRVLGRDFAQVAAGPRRSALRLFHASSADLRGDLSRLSAALPREWSLQIADLPAFVAAAARAKVSMSEAADLCARFVCSASRHGPLDGGLSLLAPGALPASPAELAELGRTAWKYAQMSGFRRLLSLLG